MEIVVLGCGVSGLSTAIRLQERGFGVHIVAKDLPRNTTSDVAAAIWQPYKAFPVDRVIGWGKRAFDVFTELASDPSTGVRPIEALEVHREPATDPWWVECVPNFRHARRDELPGGYRDGYVFGTFVVETPRYMTYLVGRFRDAEGRIEQREVPELEPLLKECDVLVNCTGLGSRDLLGDRELFPIRGQVLRTTLPSVERALVDEDEERGLTYVIPRSDDCILGGTAQAGDWSLEPNEDDALGIVERCTHLAPETRTVEVLQHLLGLRPGRSAVRLEAQTVPGDKLIVHNYGHGGAGITLSWGCAAEAASLVEAAFNAQQGNG